MEAATGAPAAADGGEAQVEGQNQQQQEAAPEWQGALQQVDTRLDSALDGIRDLAQLVNTRLPEPQQEAGPDFEQQWNDLFEGNGGYGVDPSQIQNLVNTQAQQIAEQAIAPIQQQLQAFQQQMTAQELSGLTQQFPELNEQKNADALAEQVWGAVGEMLPPGLPPQIAEGLAQNHNFVRLVHLAEKAKSRAQQETPAGQGQPVPQVEQGGGAAPQTGSEEDEWSKIANFGKAGNGRVW